MAKKVYNFAGGKVTAAFIVLLSNSTKKRWAPTASALASEYSLERVGQKNTIIIF